MITPRNRTASALRARRARFRGDPENMTPQLLRTPFTDLVGVRHPVVQTGMGWVSGARLTSGTANAGGLGILASATMTLRGARAGDPRGQEPHRRSPSA